MAIADGLFEWDIDELSAALKITTTDARTYFTDGRRVSRLLERRIAYEVLDGTLAGSEGAGYDVLDSQGRKWEVRSVSKGGISFCPSYMVVKGRQLEERGFLEKLQEVAGYVVSEIQRFPAVPYWRISADTVLTWWRQGDLGPASKISREQALSLLRRL
jgi:hypothetical protein